MAAAWYQQCMGLTDLRARASRLSLANINCSPIPKNAVGPGGSPEEGAHGGPRGDVRGHPRVAAAARRPLHAVPGPGPVEFY